MDQIRNGLQRNAMQKTVSIDRKIHTVSFRLYCVVYIRSSAIYCVVSSQS